MQLFFNEEGRLHGLPPNREIDSNIYVGTLIVAGRNENGEFCSLSPIQREAYQIRFDSPKTREIVKPPNRYEDVII